MENKHPRPENETERVRRLREYNILDSASEPQFDELAQLAAKLLDVPMCLISLIDDDRQWFKATVGLDVTETPREISFCQYAILDSFPLVVKDATQDLRFRENPLVTGDPEIRFYAGAPLIDEDGFALGTICAIDNKPKEITPEQKEILRTISRTIIRLIQLRKADQERKKINRFFEMSINLLAIASMDGYFKYINPTWSKLLGWTSEELTTRPFIEFIHPDDIESTYKEVKKLSQGIEVVGFKNRYRTTEGDWVWLSWMSQFDKKTNEIYAVAHDISNLIDANEKLQTAVEEANKAAQVKDEFLSNMSHEIRTPLNAIIGFNNLLRQTPLNKQQEEYLETVSVASQSLLVLINDVLDVSKLESGNLRLEQDPIDIVHIANNAIRVQSQAAKAKDLKLLLSVDQSIPNWVVGDQTRLMQILVNLISNAIKFTEKGYVELRILSEEEKGGKAMITFSVKDTGIGIAENKLQNIFERFTQAETSTTRKYGGTGLGLSIVRMLVNLFGGTLAVESTVGRGSEFSFSIPFPITDPIQEIPTLAETKFSENQLEGIRILLVEDNKHNQILAKTYIRKNGGSVEIAENGQEAVNKVETGAYDIILMDLQMPLMDGYQATEYIRKRLKRTLPIIACSAHSLVGERDKCLQKGMDDYIAKPYVEKQLIQKIKYFASLDRGDGPSNEGATPDLDEVSEILQQIESREGTEFLDSMLDILREELPVNIAEIENAILRKNMKTLEEKAHYVAGSLSTLNFEKGYTLAKATQSAVKQQHEDEAIRLAKSLVSYLRKTLSQVG